MKDKYDVPYFLRADYQIPEANLRTKAERDMDKLLKATDAKGYVRAIHDLRAGLAKCPSPALLELLEPYLRNVLLQAHNYEEQYGRLK